MTSALARRKFAESGRDVAALRTEIAALWQRAPEQGEANGRDAGHVMLIAEGSSPQDMLRHPRHEAAQKVLPELITQLRQCMSVAGGYEAQKALLDQVLVAETDRNGFSNAAKRMRAHKQPQAGNARAAVGI